MRKRVLNKSKSKWLDAGRALEPGTWSPAPVTGFDSHIAIEFMWTVDDVTLNWLKVRNTAGRIYFVPWEQDSEFLRLQILKVIPADPHEGASLTLTLPAEKSGAEQRVWSAIRDAGLADLWHCERRSLKEHETLEPVSVPIQEGA